MFYDFESQDVISIYDELPLWAAPFGLVLLDAIDYIQNSVVLDIGPGTGFPMLEIAQRLGTTAKVYGLDPWKGGLQKTLQKASVYGLSNVSCVQGIAESIPFSDNFFDLIISNNGINNVTDTEQALSECYRVLKTSGQFVFTINLPHTMEEFYSVYRKVLLKLGMLAEIDVLTNHIHEKRKSVNEMIKLLENAGFSSIETTEECFTMKFSNGTALLNHFFIKLYFLRPWINVVGNMKAERVFARLEEELNSLARELGVLNLTIPYACFSCRKNNG